MNTAPRYIVKTASAHMPQSCKFGTYRRVAVLEVEPGFAPRHVKMISGRARGVVRVVRTWERLNVGTTVNCAYDRALAEAHALAEELDRRHRVGLPMNPQSHIFRDATAGDVA